MSNPYQILAQLLPRARSEEELVAMAAELGEPPPITGKPPAATIQPTGARLQGMPKSNLVEGGANIVPPMTQGESRTKPNIGQTLLGY